MEWGEEDNDNMLMDQQGLEEYHISLREFGLSSSFKASPRSETS